MKASIQSITRILRATIDTEVLSEPDPETTDVLRSIGLTGENGAWTVDRKSRLKLALTAVEMGIDMETLVTSLNWKDFERLIAGVLEEHGYRCIESFRKRGSSATKGMEIDVIGVSGRRVVALDAKMWNIRGGKASALAAAALRQKDRTQKLSRMLPELSERLPLFPGEYQFVPALVTWLVEDLEIHEGVPVVPVLKLNTFLLDLDVQDEVFVSFTGDLPS